MKVNSELRKYPSYYAIIPAEVRYSDLKPNAKLLYGEITALSNSKGFCYAGNKYFADLYKVSCGTISRWIRELKEFKFIEVNIIRNSKKEIIERTLLPICAIGIAEMSKDNTHSINANICLDSNIKDNNNTNNNNTNNIIKSIIERRKEFKEKVFLSNLSSELCQEFIDYWTETNKSRSKMKFELEKTFDIKRRLSRWLKNDKKWNKKKSVMDNHQTWLNVIDKINKL